MAERGRRSSELVRGGEPFTHDRNASPHLPPWPTRSVPADYVVWAAGGSPNTSIFTGGDLASSLDAKGYVKVDEFLRLEGHSNVFVVGDINSTPGPKLGVQAGFQVRLGGGGARLLLRAGDEQAGLLAAVRSNASSCGAPTSTCLPATQADSIAANLLKVVAGGAPVKFKPAMPPTGAMFVTFGKGDGVGHVQGCNCAGSFPISFIKGKDLFVGMARSNLGVK